MLFCLANDAEGGESIFVDGFRLAEDLRQSNPQVFRNLCETNWEWAYFTEDNHNRFTAPILTLDSNNQICAVRSIGFHRGPLQVPYNQVDECYNGLVTWLRLLKESQYQVSFRLKPGDLIAFDNRRILHGRTHFDIKSGFRHLIACYLDKDNLMSQIPVFNGKIN